MTGPFGRPWVTTADIINRYHSLFLMGAGTMQVSKSPFAPCCAGFLALLLVAGCENSAPASANNSSQSPNVIIVLTDDLGYGDIGAYGAKRIKTPNIDQLADRGILFTNAYASANVCSPSRAGLMTGRYAVRSGLAWKVVGANDKHGLPESEETLGELAKRAGYMTHYIGKWHLGGFPDYLPGKHGFDSFFGVPHSNDMPGFVLYENDQVIDTDIDQALLTQRYTESALQFIEAQGDQAFLMVVSHTFPHIPLYASEQFRGKSEAGAYGDTIEEIDWSTGKIVEALKKTGQLENTVIIFTSDNGPFFEGRTAGLKGGKGNAWEGGFRVPLIVSWPGKVAHARSSDAITVNTDILPTVAHAIAIEPGSLDLDGKSLMGILEGEQHSPHEFIYLFNNERVVGVRSQDWKLVTHAYYTGSLGSFEKFDQLSGFDQPYDLLFDMRQSDGEAYSVANRQPAELNTHQVALRNARAKFGPMRTRDLEKTYPD
ncbi:MAG: sulfatase [Pseudomonadota bacterium]